MHLPNSFNSTLLSSDSIYPGGAIQIYLDLLID